MADEIKIITLGTSHGDPTSIRFNTSTLIDIPNYGGILIDAGTPVLGLLVRKNYPLDKLKAIFITHMHQDHFGGIPDILKIWVKRLPEDKVLKIFLPEAEAMETIFAFTELAHRAIPRNRFEIYQVSLGDLSSQAGLNISAIKTDHFSNEGKSFPSYAYKIVANDKTILCAGDIARDFHDYPCNIVADVAMCELTHYDLAKAIPHLQKEQYKKLIFTHVGDWYHVEANLVDFEKLVSQLPYPVALAYDGDEFIV